MVVEQFINEKIIQNVLHHSNLSSQEVYTNPSTKAINNALNLSMKILDNNYSRFFPVVYLSKKIKSSSFSFSFKEYIKRPSYQQLIPYKRYSSSLYYYTGNPNLRAYFPRSFEFIYTYDNALTFRTTYQSTKNSIQEYNRRVGNTLLTEGTNQNNGAFNSLVLSLNYNKRFTKKFYLKTKVNYIRGKQMLILDDTEEFKYDGYTFTIAPSYKITDKLRCSAYYYYSSDVFFGVTEKLSFSFLDFDIAYELFDGDAEITFSGRDIFLQSITGYRSDYNNLTEFSNNDWGSRQLIVSFSYYFETNGVKAQRYRNKTANKSSIDRL